MVPSGCYISAGAELGAPKGQILIPENEPVTLNIHKHDGFCTLGLKTLKFNIKNIPLSGGKTALVAFVQVDDELVAVGSTPILSMSQDKNEDVSSLLTTKTIVSSGAEVESISAWINAQPPTPHQLILIANMYAPCMNYDYKFTDLGPFGFTGRTLLVRLEATLTSGCQKGIFQGPVRFEKQLKGDNLFDSIALEFEGELFIEALDIAS